MTVFDEMFVAREKNDVAQANVHSALNRMNEIVKSARACLNHQEFAKYKSQYEKEEQEMMSVMIAYTNSFVLAENANPTMYAMRMAMFIQKIYDLRRLLKNVEADATRTIGESNDRKT